MFRPTTCKNIKKSTKYPQIKCKKFAALLSCFSFLYLYHFWKLMYISYIHINNIRMVLKKMFVALTKFRTNFRPNRLRFDYYVCRNSKPACTYVSNQKSGIHSVYNCLSSYIDNQYTANCTLVNNNESVYVSSIAYVTTFLFSRPICSYSTTHLLNVKSISVSWRKTNRRIWFFFHFIARMRFDFSAISLSTFVCQIPDIKTVCFDLFDVDKKNNNLNWK